MSNVKDDDSNVNMPYLIRIFLYLYSTPVVKPEYPLYFVPWTRYQSYGVGILAGLLIWHLKDMKVRLSKVSF